MAALSPLVTVGWLNEHLEDEQLRIADCRFYLDEPDRGHAEYVAGHIPGARYFSLDDHLTGGTGPGRHPLPSAVEFTDRMTAIGIGDQNSVVVYDDAGAGIAARLWWMLRSLGHSNVKVLDGGWRAWVAASHPISSDIPEWAPTRFTGSGFWAGTVDRDELAARSRELTLVDSRAPARFRGEDEPIDPVAGHIPGAINIPYQDNTDATGCFRPKEELADRFRAVESGARVIVYCGSGVTACNNLLALEIAGHRGAQLYPGSWSDWCNSGGKVGRV